MDLLSLLDKAEAEGYVIKEEIVPNDDRFVVFGDEDYPHVSELAYM